MASKDIEELRRLLEKAFDGAIYNMNHREGWKCFDWVTAAKIIKERNPHTAYAFLKENRAQTGGRIWFDHAPFYDDWTLLESRWDTPIFEIDGEQIDCYINPWDVEPESKRFRLGWDTRTRRWKLFCQGENTHFSENCLSFITISRKIVLPGFFM